MSALDLYAPCVQYEGYLDRHGYGNTHGRLAHRLVYEEAYGPVPAGLEIDHVCHSVDLSCVAGPNCPHRSCVNLLHLEAVTHQENALRGRSFSAVNASKTHCDAGHPYNDKNTYWRRNGGRDCRPCGVDRQRRRRARRNAA